MRLVLRNTSFFIFLLFFISCSTTRKVPVVSQTMSSLAQDYINKYSGMAVSEMKRTGIPASITLAQGMLESDFGRSSLATQANNHFGIKCHNGWTGNKIYHDDDKKNDCFRRYRNAEESYRDHSDFLVTGSRYKSLFNLSSTDYKAWAHGLKKSGYATNPDYPSLLIDNIEKYDLHSFDTGTKRRQLANNTVVSGNNPDVSVSSQTQVSGSSQGGIVIMAGQGRLKELNRIQYIIVKDGDTFESLAEEFQLLKWEIAKYNELPSDVPLTPGQIIYLQPKRTKADVGFETYLVREGDTMYMISQKYGIKLESLYKLNLMEAGTEPVAGKKIKLR